MGLDMAIANSQEGRRHAHHQFSFQLIWATIATSPFTTTATMSTLCTRLLVLLHLPRAIVAWTEDTREATVLAAVRFAHAVDAQGSIHRPGVEAPNAIGSLIGAQAATLRNNHRGVDQGQRQPYSGGSASSPLQKAHTS